MRVRHFIERWERVVQQWPDAVAVEGSRGSVTVAELDAGASAVAAGLSLHGVGRGDGVAVCLDHDVALFEVVIGVLRCAAAFVPIDVRNSTDRVSQITTAAGAKICVAEADGEGFGCHQVSPGALKADGRGAEPTSTSGQPGDPAYILFTSGSTGAPKGVVVPHRSLDTYLEWAVTHYMRFGLGGTALFTSVAFDLTVTSLLAPLVAGRPIHPIPADEGLFGVADLLGQGVCFDFLKLTPSHLRLLLAVLEDMPPTGLVACVVVGGEILPASLVRRWRQVFPQGVVVNEYGPTEATVGCCVAELNPYEPVPDEVAIGTAIPAASLYTLDSEGRPAPKETDAELYIGGDVLADGYLADPIRTAERFVADPHGIGRRMYRTGDVVRQAVDGSLAFVGRNDDQLKIRGHRIALGEVTTAVQDHAEVADGLVRAWHRDADDVRLVAYVVPARRADRDHLAAALVEAVGRRLPPNVTIQHVVTLDELPYTVNGKVDIARLPGLPAHY